MSLLKRMARSLKLGKEKFYVGRDLEGNSFYERPSTEYVDEWRKAKRTVEYLVERPLSEYRFASIPAQWNSWLRRTRRSPPSMSELEADFQRQQRLQINVDRLAIEYREEKLRLAERLELEVREGREVEGRRMGEQGGALLESGVGEGEVGEAETKGEEEGKESLRKKFAEQNAFKRPQNPDSDFQPDSWSPAPRRR